MKTFIIAQILAVRRSATLYLARWVEMSHIPKAYYGWRGKFEISGYGTDFQFLTYNAVYRTLYGSILISGTTEPMTILPVNEK